MQRGARPWWVKSKEKRVNSMIVLYKDPWKLRGFSMGFEALTTPRFGGWFLGRGRVFLLLNPAKINEWKNYLFFIPDKQTYKTTTTKKYRKWVSGFCETNPNFLWREERKNQKNNFGPIEPMKWKKRAFSLWSFFPWTKISWRKKLTTDVFWARLKCLQNHGNYFSWKRLGKKL